MTSAVRITSGDSFGTVKYRFYQSASVLITAIQTHLLDVSTDNYGPHKAYIRVDMLFEQDEYRPNFDPKAFQNVVEDIRVNKPDVPRYGNHTTEQKKAIKAWRREASYKLAEVTHGLLT